jgi:hypothetical protein
MSNVRRHRVRTAKFRLPSLVVAAILLSMLVALVWFGIRPSREEKPKAPVDLGDDLHAFAKRNLQVRGDPYCERITFCGSLVQIECRPESDGPINYYDASTGALLAQCGFWESRQFHCPPPEWKACMVKRNGQP